MNEEQILLAERISEMIEKELSGKFLYEFINDATILSFKQKVYELCKRYLDKEVVPIINKEKLKEGILQIENFEIDGELLYQLAK